MSLLVALSLKMPHQGSVNKVLLVTLIVIVLSA